VRQNEIKERMQIK